MDDFLDFVLDFIHDVFQSLCDEGIRRFLSVFVVWKRALSVNFTGWTWMMK